MTLDQNIDPKNRFFKAAALVDKYCIDRDLPVDKYFNKFLSRLLFGIVDLKMDAANDVITVLLPISDVNTVTLPENYVNWVKIGIPYGQYVKTLCINDDLSTQDRTLGNPEFSKEYPPGWLPNGTDISDYGGYYFSNYGGDSLFSIGGGLPQSGHIKVVQRPGSVYEILLDAGIPAENLYVEYIGLGINPCGETVLSPMLGEWAISYLDHQYERFMPPAQRSETAIQRTGRELWHQEQKVRGRTQTLTPDDLLRITRRSYRLTNKV
jgi:hypothetical protein